MRVANLIELPMGRPRRKPFVFTQQSGCSVVFFSFALSNLRDLGRWHRGTVASVMLHFRRKNGAIREDRILVIGYSPLAAGS